MSLCTVVANVGCGLLVPNTLRSHIAQKLAVPVTSISSNVCLPVQVLGSPNSSTLSANWSCIATIFTVVPAIQSFPVPQVLGLAVFLIPLVSPVSTAGVQGVTPVNLIHSS